MKEGVLMRLVCVDYIQKDSHTIGYSREANIASKYYSHDHNGKIEAVISPSYDDGIKAVREQIRNLGMFKGLNATDFLFGVTFNNIKNGMVWSDLGTNRRGYVELEAGNAGE